MAGEKSSGTTPIPARGRRLGESETRERMLADAVAALVDGGAGVGLEHVRMERIITSAGVSRATAYRIWPGRAEFLADVLVEAVKATNLIPETADDIERLIRVVLEAASALESAQARRNAVVETLRIAVDADVRRILQSHQWRLFHALAVTHETLAEPELRGIVREALADALRGFTARRVEIYAGLAHLLGYRLAPPWRDQGGAGLEVLASIAGSLMTGLVQHARVLPEWLDERREIALFGSSVTAPWSTPEIAGVGMILDYLEPDPEVVWTSERVEAALHDLRSAIASPPGTSAEFGSDGGSR